MPRKVSLRTKEWTVISGRAKAATAIEGRDFGGMQCKGDEVECDGMPLGGTTKDER